MEMASVRASQYVRDRDGRGGRSASSPSDDAESDEEHRRKEEDGGGSGGEGGVARLPTMRSVIVRVTSNSNDEKVDERRGDPGANDDDDQGRESRSPLPPPPATLPFPPPAMHSSSRANSRDEENRRRGDTNRVSGPAYGLAMSKSITAKGSETEEGRGTFRSRGGEREREDSRRERDWDGKHNSKLPEDKDGIAGLRGGQPRERLRDLDHDHRDRAVPRRDHHSRSPPRMQHHSRSPPPRGRVRDVDEGRDNLRRGEGKKRDIERSLDEDDEQHEGRYDDANVDRYENGAKGKAKDHREEFRRDQETSGRGHPADHQSRRHRNVSPTFRDRRDAGAGSRSPLSLGKSSRGGRNGVDWGRGKERDDERDDWRGGKRETDRGRDGRGRGRGGGDAGENFVPELYSIHRASVHSIRPFGIFVRIDGYRNHGMVHLTQISNHEVTDRKDSDEEKVKAISSVVGEGEQVFVKVISVQHEDGGRVKVGCSLKLVSQGDGKDLDPNNLQLEKHQSKSPWQGPKKLELDAVYNVSCTRCGGHGHLKKECYSTGERTYEILEDAETDEGAGAVGLKAAAATGAFKKLTPAVGQSSKPPSGPAGRGRAMVRPAWMTHGVGVGGDQEKVLGSHSSKSALKLPEKVTSLEDALAVLEMAKEEKKKRKLERRLRKSRKEDKKHSNKEGRKEKHKKRHRSEDDNHHTSKKKRRL